MDDITKRILQQWAKQIEFNRSIRAMEQITNFEYWMKQYLLGLVSEVDEVLAEINWKIHRRGKPMNKHNLGRELADITKYVMSLWEWAGFDLGDVLDFVEEKTEELDAQTTQEFHTSLAKGQPVIISDIDGTIGNYRKAFAEWAVANTDRTLVATVDDAEHLAQEVDLGMDYLFYENLKERFEAEGGYKQLELYPEVASNLREAITDTNAALVLYTARPASRFSRIWMDTWQWLQMVGIQDMVFSLNIGKEERISKACLWQAQGHPIVLLEDDPGTAIRAAATGIHVILRDQPYNAGIEHINIIRVSGISAGLIKDWMK